MHLSKEYKQHLAKHKLDEEMILRYCQPEGNDIVLLCGSIIEGFSNVGSDLDVYILTDNVNRSNFEFIEKKTYFGKEYHILKHDTPINIIVVNMETVKFVINEINSSLAENRIDFTEMKKIEFFHRLITAVPIYNMLPFENLIRIKLDKKQFSKILGENRYKFSENRHDDAIGALESEDYLTAYLAARASLEAAMESLLYFKGHTNPKKKWLIKKINISFDLEDEWVQDFLIHYIGKMVNFSPETLTKNSIASIQLANKIRNYKNSY